MHQTRRKFLETLLIAGGGIAAGGSILPSCNNAPQETSEQKLVRERAALRAMEPTYDAYVGPHMALKTLETATSKGTTLVDVEGNPVNLAALTERMKGRPSTISFMFAACPSVCPRTTQALKAMSEKNDSSLHVVISVMPKDDFYGRSYTNGSHSMSLPETLNKRGLRTGPGGNTIVLFPVGKGNTLEERLQHGDGWEFQHQLELITRGKAPEGHSAAVTLYEPSGRYRDYYVGDTVDELVDNLLPNVTKGRAKGL